MVIREGRGAADERSCPSKKGNENKEVNSAFAFFRLLDPTVASKSENFIDLSHTQLRRS